MGQTVASVTAAGYTVQNDGDISPILGNGPLAVAFASMGTGPTATTFGADGRTTLRVTAGTGSPAIAANNVQVTCGRTPRKVFLAASNPAPGFHVASIAGNVINIGTKVAPVASAVYDLELIIAY